MPEISLGDSVVIFFAFVLVVWFDLKKREGKKKKLNWLKHLRSNGSGQKQTEKTQSLT
jgi:hypothetical protein